MYKPWTFAFNGHWQAILFPLVENIFKLIRKINLQREEIILSDGGTILLEWGECDSKKQRLQTIDLQADGDTEQVRTNPLVIIVPGLTGDSSNLYMTSLIVEAHKHNYDTVIVNYRC